MHVFACIMYVPHISAVPVDSKQSFVSSLAESTNFVTGWSNTNISHLTTYD